MSRCLTRWDENEAGKTHRDFVKGQTRARHEDSPKGGEFRAWHGFAADTRLGIFERGVKVMELAALAIKARAACRRTAQRKKYLH